MGSWWVTADEFRQFTSGAKASLARIEASLARLETQSARLNAKVEAIMPTVDDIVTKVGELSDVENGVIALLDQIHQMLSDAVASQDPAKIQAALDALEARKGVLAEAVTRNTPSA